MIKLKSVFLALAVLLLLGACSSDSSDSYDGFDYSGKSTVEVTGNILGASPETTQDWAGENAIGLYAVRTGNVLSDETAYDNKINVKYTSLATGGVAMFQSAQGNEAIQLKKGRLDLIGYSPYSSNLKDCKYPLDLANRVDVLYSNNVQGIGSGEQAKMVFKHVLSQLIIQITPGENVNTLVGLKADNLSGIATKGTLDLATGEVLADLNSIGNVKTTVAVNASQASIQSFIIPGKSVGEAKIMISLEGKQYFWTLEEDLLIEPGKTYTYSMIINADGSWTLEPNGTVTDWTEGNTDDDIEVLNPDGSGSGDTEDPDKDVVGEEVILMSESFGDNVTKRWDLKNDDFNTYTEFDSKGVLFSNEGTRLVGRAINNVVDSQGLFDKHMWFPKYDEKLDIKKSSTPTLVISNINTVGLKQITLSYDILPDMRTQKKVKAIDVTALMVFIDDQQVQVPSFILTREEYMNKYYKVTLKIDKPFSKLTFKTAEANTPGIRLDNLQIKGYK